MECHHPPAGKNSVKHYFIAATGTNIGKTALTTALCWQLRQKNLPVTALKPVISGYTPEDAATDTALILQSCDIPPSPEAIAAISPWRFLAPLAPSLAAQKENTAINFDDLLTFCRQSASPDGITLIEGVGGVHVPLTATHTTADWMQALGWPVILVCGTYLGAISHTLSALEILKNRNIPVKALVISESESASVTMDETASMLELFVPPAIPVIKILRQPAHPQSWKQWPPLSWICDE